MKMMWTVEIKMLNEHDMGSNPLEVPKLFQVNLQLLKLQLPLWRSYLHLKSVFPRFYVPSIIAEYARYPGK